MNRNLAWIGFMATGLLMLTLAMAVLREPTLQARAADQQLQQAISEGMAVYVEQCIICHGASGEGLVTYPALNIASSMDSETLFKTIERGRYGTQMAAYGVAEGGILSDTQINGLIALIQQGSWQAVYALADAKGVIPPEMVVAEIPEAMITTVSSLPGGEALATGLKLYAENCTACHGVNLEGSALALALNTETLRVTDSLELVRRIEQGVPGTLMAGWDNAFTDIEVDAVVALIQRWQEVQTAGIAIPVVEAKPLDMSPEAITRGARLFSITCVSCHGQSGYGTQIAPALNNALFLDGVSDTQIHQIIAMGVNGTLMPAWGGRLSEAQINDLIVYMRSWQGSAPVITQPR